MAEKRLVYVLERYPFYSGMVILMISEDYNEVKKVFDKIANEKGYGYCITEHEVGVYYEEGRNQYIDWIEINTDGKIKNIMEL